MAVIKVTTETYYLDPIEVEIIELLRHSQGLAMNQHYCKSEAEVRKAMAIIERRYI